MLVLRMGIFANVYVQQVQEARQPEQVLRADVVVFCRP